MTILDISPKSRAGSYIWEHVMKTAMGLLGTFGGIFFLLFISGGKSKTAGGKDAALELMVFLFTKHVEVTILICVAAALIFNLSAYWNNRKKIFPVKIEFNSETNQITIQLISVYSDDSIEKVLDLKNCSFYEQRIRNFLIGSHKVVSIGDEYGVEFARIDLSSDIHSKFSKKVKESLRILNELKPIKTIARKTADTDPSPNFFG